MPVPIIILLCELSFSQAFILEVIGVVLILSALKRVWNVNTLCGWFGGRILNFRDQMNRWWGDILLWEPRAWREHPPR